MSKKLILSALSLTLLASAPAHAQADKITIMVGGMEKIIYLPAKLAEVLGYYKAEGLNVELQNEPAGVDAETQLIAGQVEGVVGFYDHTIDMQAQGQMMQSVVQFSRAPGEVILVSNKTAPNAKSMADLKGNTIGVTGLGSSTSFLSQYLMSKNNIKPGQFSLLAVGAGTTFIAAMDQNQIQAGMTTEPTISRLLKTGDARVLVDMRTKAKTKAALGGTYPAACLYMQTEYVNAHKDVVQKLANAYVKTLKYIATHNGAQIAALMPKDYSVGDVDSYIKALNDGKGMFTTDGIMPSDGPKTVLNVLASFKESLKGKTIDLSQTYTTAFAKAAK
ncbi:ABC transporter substrate-binding protein [Deinococcus sp.]|uniref:ABC transporter substrate-binding protein n=1 Tax=Deinococcus sp. TaxID=47478 RepID=UPI003B5ACAAD